LALCASQLQTSSEQGLDSGPRRLVWEPPTDQAAAVGVSGRPAWDWYRPDPERMLPLDG